MSCYGFQYTGIIATWKQKHESWLQLECVRAPLQLLMFSLNSIVTHSTFRRQLFLHCHLFLYPIHVSQSHSTPIILLTPSFVCSYSTSWASHSQLEDAIEKEYWFFSSSVRLQHGLQVGQKKNFKLILRKRERQREREWKSGMDVTKGGKEEEEDATCGHLYWWEEENTSSVYFS